MTIDSAAAWHCVAGLRAGDLAEGVITEGTAGGEAVCILRRGETLYAFAAHCPHAGARLCEGWVDARGSVVCPAHTYRFDPRNGYNRSGEGYKLKTYRVEVREGETIWVAL